MATEEVAIMSLKLGMTNSNMLNSNVKRNGELRSVAKGIERDRIQNFDLGGDKRLIHNQRQLSREIRYAF